MKQFEVWGRAISMGETMDTLEEFIEYEFGPIANLSPSDLKEVIEKYIDLIPGYFEGTFEEAMDNIGELIEEDEEEVSEADIALYRRYSDRECSFEEIKAWFLGLEPEHQRELLESMSYCEISSDIQDDLGLPTPNGMAIEFFEDEPTEVWEALKLEVVDGECPFSSYYAVELGVTVEEANRICEREGWEYRFVQQD